MFVWVKPDGVNQTTSDKNRNRTNRTQSNNVQLIRLSLRSIDSSECLHSIDSIEWSNMFDCLDFRLIVDWLELNYIFDSVQSGQSLSSL